MNPDLVTALFLAAAVVHVGAVQIVVARVVYALFRSRVCPACRDAVRGG